MKSSVNHHRRWSVLTLTLLAGIMIIPNITRSGMTKTRLLKTPTPMMSTIIVTTTANTIAADGQCSLREAIINANNEAATHADCLAGSGADTIVLQASTTYTLDVRDNTEYGFNGLPAITSAITIEGNGATITRSGSASTFRHPFRHQERHCHREHPGPRFGVACRDGRRFALDFRGLDEAVGTRVAGEPHTKLVHDHVHDRDHIEGDHG